MDYCNQFNLISLINSRVLRITPVYIQLIKETVYIQLIKGTVYNQLIKETVYIQLLKGTVYIQLIKRHQKNIK